MRRRDRPDGLPSRVYERHGLRLYSIGFKAPDGTWTFRLKCPVHDTNRINALRLEAQIKAAECQTVTQQNTFSFLLDQWIDWQERLPCGSLEKRAASTMAENRREAEMLRKAFGHMHTSHLTKTHAYEYLTAWSKSKVMRSAKANKEISLGRTILEYGVRLGYLQSNPFDGVVKLKTHAYERLVTDQELDLAVRVGRELGGPRHIVAMALKTAYLCVRRSVEVRALTRDQIQPDGIHWTAAKRQRGQSARVGLIEWSPELRAVIDEALDIKRNKLAGSWHVFGNMQGQPYTKGGWKKTLSELMKVCVEKARADGVAFTPFSLQDCRPKGVSDKLALGHQDVLNATLHTSDRMVRQVYDRRFTKVAKPVR